ncbi:pseudouridine-5'-monophosphatase-like [Pyrus ussuriensis x Pyrus communis]|uniref:Pseudouridine-5'-monophosphatase-like n=1 Tax=Pyrus ussuriensis x Pyrus communis TaxID=2448454 RepID=A0A5N5FC03_9ROSA|nr:pseudouridine-5'-monophosphatase-like [Pyrus ussuriensis x Pyrus communis]
MDYACSSFRSSSLLLPWRSPPCRSTKMAKHPRVVRSSYAFNENGSVNGFPVIPNKLFMQEEMISHAPFHIFFICWGRERNG